MRCDVWNTYRAYGKFLCGCSAHGVEVIQFYNITAT